MITFDNKAAEKKLVITVSGFIREEEGEAFLNDYNRHIGMIKPAEYTLIVDSTGLSASKPEMLPVLEGCFRLYMSNGFKKILMVRPSSTISKIQMEKLAKSIDYTGIFVDKLEDAFNHA
ncbi:hypothetical protein [Paenibacillus turpanensis]|uniref:hypothetical protein n=1 Tax=Paenibacillus turpanensis TaxID=2689078 RepID=UPI001408AFD0|nr:hypothetical protein [Paenibacillus turpanensis]